MQAGIRLACDGAAALVGLGYFIWTIGRLRVTCKPKFSLPGLKVLAKAGLPFFLESAIRNALYLYQTSTIISLSSDYATAWGVYNTIRWGLVMVPVSTLSATAEVFVGHRYGLWNKTRGSRSASWRDLYYIAKPALTAAAIAVLIETVLCLLLTFRLIYPFATYISNSSAVSAIIQHMWRSIDWCYVIGYALSTLLATIIVATRPILYLLSSLLSNICYVLPWTIVIQYAAVKPGNEWFYYAFIFGGSLVVSDFTVGAMLGIWQYRLRKQTKAGILDQA